MRHQFRAVTAALVAVSVVALALVLARAQAPKATAETRKWKQTRTPWGDPDLQGVWLGTTPTPLERPLDGGKVLLTDEEVESLERELARRFEAAAFLERPVEELAVIDAVERKQVHVIEPQVFHRGLERFQKLRRRRLRADFGLDDDFVARQFREHVTELHF